ncbi:MAG TPA: SDR family oxidoreductase [Gemmatimonadaceae bacterium]|nr:SDR family oxidoreductase [Gemmatimonadaceae bacterium]
MNQSAFSNNVVVITGGSSGIGREIAYQLCAQKAQLVLAARDPMLLDAVVAECRKRGARAIGVTTDVSVEAECEVLIDRTLEEFGRIDTLINNAGISMRSRFDELGGVEPIERLMRINYFGAVYCTHYALPELKKSRGRIVATASLAGKTGVPTLSGYSASKHAMIGFFEALRIELEQNGVSVTIVCPGFVATDVASRAIGPGGKTLGKRSVLRSKVMPVAECARIIIDAAANRDREVVMTLRGKAGQWLKLAAPGVVDRIAIKTLEQGW